MDLRTATIAGVTAGALLIAAPGPQVPQPAGGPPPTVVATVRMQALFEGLDQRAEVKQELDERAEAIDAERQSRLEALRELEAQLQEITEPQRKEQMIDRVALERLKLQFWFQQALAELQVERALRLQDLFRNVIAAIKSLGEAQGYDLVLQDDAIDEPGFDRELRVPPQVQVLQQIRSQTVLFRVPAIDVTEDVITRMNNEFKATQTTPDRTP